MTTKIFLTGATGYIGGSVLETLVTKHPEYEIAVMLRKIPENFTSRYPNIKIVKGDYDSADVISEEASKANIVVHNGNSDHEASINAIIAGLLRRDSVSYLIHLGGSGIIADWETHLGELNPKVWSDIEDIDAIWSRPDKALHRNVDKIIHAAAIRHGDKLKTAIMAPPDIYGAGKGLGNKQSVYFPTLYAESKKLGHTFYTGSGKNTKSWVHIDDLMTMYLDVVEAAISGGSGADWGKEGYYFAATQEASQIELAKATGKIMKELGVIDSAEPKEVSLDTVDTMLKSYNYPGISRYMYGGNSRTRPDRAIKLFGYKSNAPSIWESVENDLLPYHETQ